MIIVQLSLLNAHRGYIFAKIKKTRKRIKICN